MEKIINEIEKGKQISQILEEMIEHQGEYEINDAYLKFKKGRIDSGDFEDIRDDIQKNYAFNTEKLAYVEKLSKDDIKLQKEYLKMINYVDEDEKNLSNFNKMSTLLTYAVMLARDTNKDNVYDKKIDFNLLDTNELYMLATAMFSIPVENYESYTSLLYNEDILNKIFLHTKDEDEQREICYDIFDYCDDVEDMCYKEKHDDIYANALMDCTTIINNYKTKEQNTDSRVR